jgi:hypothetical protein
MPVSVNIENAGYNRGLDIFSQFVFFVKNSNIDELLVIEEFTLID